MILLGANALFDLITIVFEALQLVLISSYPETASADLVENRTDISEMPAGSFQLALTLVGGAAAVFNFITLIVTMILFLVWQHRAYSNLRPLGVPRPEFSSGWVIGSWFVPFLNLVHPFQITKYILLGAIFFGMTSKANAIETGFLNRTVKVGDETYRYQVYAPRDWNKKRKWPVILFLHGAGERGDDGLIQTEVGLGSGVRRYSDRFPAIIVMPQCRKNSWWTQDAMQEQALKAFEQSIKEFNGDRDQLYLTGISMGGYGTWSIASKHPGKFAALVPVCGGVKPPPRIPVPDADKLVDPNVDPYAAIAQKIGKTPVWIFHGGADTVVPTDESRKVNEALKAAGGNVKYTEYEKVAHNSWDKAYAEPELLKWMLSQSLKAVNSTGSEKATTQK